MNRKSDIKPDAIVEIFKQRGQANGHLTETNGNGAEANEKGRSDQFDQEGQTDKTQQWQELAEMQKQLVVISYQALVKADQCRTISYWDLGDAILQLRMNEHIKHGEWLVFLKEQGIRYQPVKKAMRIRRKHETLESCQHLTVEEALGYDEVSFLNQESDADEEALQMALLGGSGAANKKAATKPVAHKKKKKAASVKQSHPDPNMDAEPNNEVTTEEMDLFLTFVQAVGNLQRAKVVFEEGVWRCEQVGGLDGMKGE